MVSASSVMTGWGAGLHSLPTQARTAAAGCRVVPLLPPVSDDERLRRATRECLLAVTTVEQALARSTLTRLALAGPRTALIYASASAYAAANWTFLTADKEQALYFPYTAASAVPGEVTIQFGITGPYLSLLSGANAGIEALWQAATLLTTEQCDRVLVLGVETFMECQDLFASGRWLLSSPLVEAAVCLILERHPALAEVGYHAGSSDDGVAMLHTILEEQTPAAVYLCLPTVRDNDSTTQRLRARWPEFPSVPSALGLAPAWRAHLSSGYCWRWRRKIRAALCWYRAGGTPGRCSAGRPLPAGQALRRMDVMTQDEVVVRLKKLMAERLRITPERLQTLTLDTPLLKDGLGLDSLDCVELLIGIEDEFGLAFDDNEENWIHHFACLDMLSRLVLSARGEQV
jgi:acyl carrier protein